MTKRQTITNLFLAEVSAQIQCNPNGMHAAIRAAFDKVFPAVGYDAFVDDLYRSLRAQAGIAA
jgi:hypothetical protein